MARHKQSRAQKRAKRRSHHDRRDSRGGARYSFSDINKAMGMNPRRGKKRHGKRRNPNQFPTPFQSGLNPRRGKKRRNPSGLERTLRDGTSLSLHRDGDQGVLYIHHANGTMDDFRGAWKRALSKFKAFKSGKTHRRHAEASAWNDLAMDNPKRRGRKGKTRRNCGMVEDPRWATTRIIRKGHRRNPAQFPMPFVSAMNPRRTRRNFPINAKQARTMGKVLRQHGYKKCRI